MLLLQIIINCIVGLFRICFVCAFVDLYPAWGRNPFPGPVFYFYGQASRPISTGQLNALLHLHTQPINVVVYNGSSGAYAQGYLILKEASRLDAFSGYPFRT